MKNKKLVQQALAGVVALGLSSAATTSFAGQHAKMEKCYGVVKAKMNDCGTSAHSCAGQAANDGNKSEWIYLPTGTCNKIVNGSTTPSDTSEKE